MCKSIYRKVNCVLSITLRSLLDCIKRDIHIYNLFYVELKRLAPEIYCNDIFLKVIFLLTLHNFKPRNVKKIYAVGLVMEIWEF